MAKLYVFEHINSEDWLDPFFYLTNQKVICTTIFEVEFKKAHCLAICLSLWWTLSINSQAIYLVAYRYWELDTRPGNFLKMLMIKSAYHVVFIS